MLFFYSWDRWECGVQYLFTLVGLEELEQVFPICLGIYVWSHLWCHCLWFFCFSSFSARMCCPTRPLEACAGIHVCSGHSRKGTNAQNQLHCLLFLMRVYKLSRSLCVSLYPAKWTFTFHVVQARLPFSASNRCARACRHVSEPFSSFSQRILEASSGFCLLISSYIIH